ncbi:MAG: superoxide dismutase, partial [archaeon]
VKRNEIEKKLSENFDILRDSANANFSEFGELKRRESFNANGIILHDLFWETVGGTGDTNEAPNLKKQLEVDFGSVDNWKKDIKACAVAAKNSGWAVLVIDKLSDGKLRNLLVDEHGVGNIWGAVPLLCIDVYEHAYYHKDGPKRAVFVDNIIASIDWKKAEDKFVKG